MTGGMRDTGWRQTGLGDSPIWGKDRKAEVCTKIPCSIRSHGHTVDKINGYDSMRAENLFKKGRRAKSMPPHWIDKEDPGMAGV